MLEDKQHIPKHIAIIMDGNNRWAKKRFLPSIAGHKAGVEAVRSVLKTCVAKQIEILTLFAFSSENWRRPSLEVKGLMELFLFAIRKEVKKLHASNIKLQIIGDLSKFSTDLQTEITKAQQLTVSNNACTLQIAANYGGQWDITCAAQKLAWQVKNQQLDVEHITPAILQQQLATHNLPPVDFLIRTGGECRISNFLLWQMAYAELYFIPILWPDFDEQAMLEALAEYARRHRLFGRTREQLTKC